MRLDGNPRSHQGTASPADGKIDRATCQAAPGHHISQDGTACVPDNPKSCPVITNTIFNDPKCGSYPIRGSIDPNEKDGPLGIGDAHFTFAADPFQYQIEFENAPAATAAAQTVTVTDSLDASKFDLTTFALGPISFGHYLLTPSPGLSTFTGALDLRPDASVIVAIQASLNQATGVITWNFTSLDPSTMQLTTDPIAGFLPPDTIPGAGVGHVAFTVHPVTTLASGAKACNSASIVFDTNPAISTAPFCNSKDTAPPASSVQPLSANISTPQFPVSWSGTDAGVGIATYTIYVSDNGGAFQPWQSAVRNTSATFSGQQDHTYAFYSRAVDQLDNAEAKTAADTTTRVGTAVPQAALAPVELSFGSIIVAATATDSLTLSNSGSATLNISGISISGANASQFKQTNTCGSTLAAGGSCTLSVTFAPTTPAGAVATVAVVDDAAGSPQTVALSGTGTPPALPKAALTPTIAAFGSVSVGFSSAAQTYTLTNTGTAPLPITSAGISGSSASSFTISANTCGSSLAGGSNCMITVIFKPSAAGAASATLSVSDSVGVQTASLTGTGTAVARALTITRSPLNFGNVTVGQTKSINVTLTNVSSTSVVVNSAVSSDPAFSTLQLNAHCGSSIPAGGSCAAAALFTPTAVKSYSVTITLSNIVAVACGCTFTYPSQTVAVNGTGIAVAPPVFSPAGGTFASKQNVTLSDASPGSIVHFTVDGSTPTASSPVYTSSIAVDITETIRTIAILDGVSSAASSASYLIGLGGCKTINYSSGFNITGLSLNGGAAIDGTTLQLTDGGQSEARSAFFSTALPTTNFTTDFTFQITDPIADGMTFTIQSNNAKVVGQGGGGLGYAGIPHSVAIKLDLHNNAGEGTDSIGTYVDGAYPSIPAINLSPAGIDLHSGHIFAGHLAYANGNTKGTIKDTVTDVSAGMNFPGDITKVVGNIAWFGFTAGTGSKSATQKILTWSYSGGPDCPAK